MSEACRRVVEKLVARVEKPKWHFWILDGELQEELIEGKWYKRSITRRLYEEAKQALESDAEQV